MSERYINLIEKAKARLWTNKGNKRGTNSREGKHIEVLQSFLEKAEERIMPNNSLHDGSSETDCDLELQASESLSEAESKRRTPGTSRPPRNPNSKRRDYPGPTPKPKESPRGEAKRKRGHKIIYQRQEPQQS
ncbi:MAG: hypothetical protein GY696_38540 [Gammaproteobacteria bacterium]|nr:hypothetical protein [Gammaproteobacteria bacterium]